MKGYVQWNLFTVEKVPAYSGLQPVTARSAGQRLTKCATEVLFPVRVDPQIPRKVTCRITSPESVPLIHLSKTVMRYSTASYEYLLVISV